MPLKSTHQTTEDKQDHSSSNLDDEDNQHDTEKLNGRNDKLNDI